MKYLLGIDFGGGSSKTTLINTLGEIIAESTAEYPTYYPHSGWCEQNPSDWKDALCENLLRLKEKSGIDFADILAVAVDSATHTAVLCDENKEPLRPAIHWTDSRSLKESKYLLDNFGDEIYSLTYHKPATFWTLPQVLWVKENEPEVFSKIRHIFFEKDYIRYLLTDVFCTDYIEAQGSMFYDCEKKEWSQRLCSLIGLDINTLPPLKNPTDVIGSITKKASEFTGLIEGTPVICGTTDTVMEVFASGAVELGDTTVKLATAGRVCVITDKAYPDRDLVNYSHVVDGLWYPGSATKSAASSLRWYRDTFSGDYKQLDLDADKVPAGSEGLIFNPYINGELTPYADPVLCGSFIGIRAHHTKAHFTRAVLEGVAFSLLHSSYKLESLGIKLNKTATLIGGGSKSFLWQQIVSDVMGLELNVTKSSDSSLGSAMLAGVAVGVFKTPKDAAKACVKVEKTITPNLDNHEKYKKFFETYVKVHDALAPIYHER